MLSVTPARFQELTGAGHASLYMKVAGGNPLLDFAIAGSSIVSVFALTTEPES